MWGQSYSSFLLEPQQKNLIMNLSLGTNVLHCILARVVWMGRSGSDWNWKLWILANFGWIWWVWCDAQAAVQRIGKSCPGFGHNFPAPASLLCILNCWQSKSTLCWDQQSIELVNKSSLYSTNGPRPHITGQLSPLNSRRVWMEVRCSKFKIYFKIKHFKI